MGEGRIGACGSRAGRLGAAPLLIPMREGALRGRRALRGRGLRAPLRRFPARGRDGSGGPYLRDLSLVRRADDVRGRNDGRHRMQRRDGGGGAVLARRAGERHRNRRGSRQLQQPARRLDRPHLEHRIAPERKGPQLASRLRSIRGWGAYAHPHEPKFRLALRQTARDLPAVRSDDQDLEPLRLERARREQRLGLADGYDPQAGSA